MTARSKSPSLVIADILRVVELLREAEGGIPVPDVLGTAVPPGAQAWRGGGPAGGRLGGHDGLCCPPPGEREPTRSQRDAAGRAMCLRCPVRRECADHALLMREPYGVWGGLTEDERSVALHGPRPVRRR